MSAVPRWLLIGLCLLRAPMAHGQALTVRPLQNLNFRFLLPGVNTTVDALQFTQSGQIEIKASIGANFEIRYTLPTALIGQGTTIPLVFSTTSGAAAPSSAPSSATRFNPNNATRWRFMTTNTATFFLGGQARPRVGQPTGAYTAPVVVTITNLGL